MIWPFKREPQTTLKQQVIDRATAHGWPLSAAESAAQIAADEYGHNAASTEDLDHICAEVLRTDGEA